MRDHLSGVYSLDHRNCHVSGKTSTLADEPFATLADKPASGTLSHTGGDEPASGTLSLNASRVTVNNSVSRSDT